MAVGKKKKKKNAHVGNCHTGSLHEKFILTFYFHYASHTSCLSFCFMSLYSNHRACAFVRPPVRASHIRAVSSVQICALSSLACVSYVNMFIALVEMNAVLINWPVESLFSFHTASLAQCNSFVLMHMCILISIKCPFPDFLMSHCN